MNPEQTIAMPMLQAPAPVDRTARLAQAGNNISHESILMTKAPCQIPSSQLPKPRINTRTCNITVDLNIFDPKFELPQQAVSELLFMPIQFRDDQP
jgi:hypothetical protein